MLGEFYLKHVGERLLRGVSFSDFSVVPSEIFLAKFKMPDLTTKYDGFGDPFIHLKIYVSELGPSTIDEKLGVHLFSKNLTGVAQIGRAHV